MDRTTLRAGLLWGLAIALPAIAAIYALDLDVKRPVSEDGKLLLLALAAGWALVWRWLPRRAAAVGLVLLASASTANYLRWGPDALERKVDAYDLIHYYLNAKYFDELGYYDLYPAAIRADHDNGGPFFPKEGNTYLAQNAAGHGWMPISHALETGARVKESRFTPERWADFTHDFLYLQRNIPGMDDALWRQLIQDHGYNGTPVWTMLARPIAEAVPVEWVKALGHIDLVVLAGGALALGWAYGAPTGAWVWLLLMTSYSTRWPMISWAFLRYDWLAALMVGMAVLRRGRPGLAGALTGLAATLRLFPAMWLAFPGIQGLFALRDGPRRKPLLVLAAGFVAAVLGLELITAARLGAEPTRVHFENMLDHNSTEQLSSRRIGLALALPFRGELEPKLIDPARKATIEEQKPLRFAIAGLAIAALGFGLRRKRPDEAFAYGFVPFFLLTTASYYYYVARVTLWALHASALPRGRHAVGLAMLIGTEVFANWAERTHDGHRVFLIGGLSWGLAAYALVQIVWLLVEDRAEPAPADAPGDAPVKGRD